jgi:hypothetical protein
MAGPEQSGNRSFLVVVGALVAVVLVVLLVVRGSRTSEPGAPSGPEMTTVTIVSDPSGATVTSADDGGVLGVTPFELTVPKKDGEMPIIVRREGYQDHRSTVPLFSATGRIDLKLTAVGEKPPPPPKPLPDGWAP